MQNPSDRPTEKLHAMIEDARQRTLGAAWQVTFAKELVPNEIGTLSRLEEALAMLKGADLILSQIR